MGLFDFLNNQNGQGGMSPGTQGLLSLSQALLEAGKPSRIPISNAQAFGGAINQALPAFIAAQSRQNVGKALQGGDLQGALKAMLSSPDPEMQKMALQGSLSNPMLMMGGLGLGGSAQPDAQNAPPQAGAPQVPPPQGNAPAMEVKPNDNRDYNYLKTLPPAIAIHVKAISDGMEDLPSGKAADDPLGFAKSTAALRFDPSLMKQTSGARQKMANDIASGQQGKDETQINSVIGHLYDLHDAAPGLKNGSSPIINAIGNGLVNWTGRGLRPELGGAGGDALQNLSRYKEILSRASPELNKFYVGGEGDKDGRALGGEAFAADLPVPVLQDNVKSQVGMLLSKSDAMQAKRDQAMGRATSPILNETSQALIADIKGEPLSPRQQQLVSARRKESNMPPKQWDAPSKAPVANISPQDARAELARRGHKF